MREQGLPVNVPALLLLKETVPVGVTGVPVSVSVTVSVQVVRSFTATEPGLQLTAVVVLRAESVNVAVADIPVASSVAVTVYVPSFQASVWVVVKPPYSSDATCQGGTVVPSGTFTVIVTGALQLNPEPEIVTIE